MVGFCHGGDLPESHDDDDEEDDDKMGIFHLYLYLGCFFKIVFVKNSKCFRIVFDDFPTKNSFYNTLQWFDLTFIKAFNKS